MFYPLKVLILPLLIGLEKNYLITVFKLKIKLLKKIKKIFYLKDGGLVGHQLYEIKWNVNIKMAILDSHWYP